MKYRHEDGTPFSKEEFQQKLKTDKEFNDEFGNKGIDQISELIKQLKENPDSRRLLVSAWNISDLPHQVLPPCHYGFQVYTREMTLEERLEWNHQNTDPSNRSMDYFPEHLDSMGVPKRKISLSWNQRSIDTLLGLAFNIASYGLLLEIIAKEVNMVPDELIGNLGDTHLYLNHITQAKEQVKREPFSLPKLKINRTLFEFGKPDPNKLDLDYYSIHNFELSHYHSHPTIKAPLSN
jgi:thymidylate synthase